MPNVSEPRENDHGAHPAFEYDQITNEIFLGTNGCCVTHFDEELTDKGIRADISLEEEQLDAAKGAQYFLWLPTKDHAAPALGQLRVGTNALRELIDAGEKVYVHCRNGHGRAPTLVAAYFILMGDDVETAIARVAAERPSIHIEEPQHHRLEEFAGFCHEKES